MIFDHTILWLVPLVAVALWLPQNAQHEGMHALAARHWGATITKMHLFPGKQSGSFAWAYVQWTGGDFDKTARGLVSIAPQFANTVLLSVLLGVRWRFPDMPEVLASILAGWYLVNFVDGAVNLATFYRPAPKPSTDGWSFSEHLGLSAPVCRLTTVLWHLWFGFHLLIPSTLI